MGNGAIQIPAIKNNLHRAAEFFNGESLLLRQQETFPAENLTQSDWSGYELLSYVDPELKYDGEKDADAIANTLQTVALTDLFWRKKVNLSHTPFWHDKGLVSKPVIMRCYALYSQGQVFILPQPCVLRPRQRAPMAKQK